MTWTSPSPRSSFFPSLSLLCPYPLMLTLKINNASLISTPSWPPSVDFPIHIHFNTSVALDIPFSLIIHPSSSVLLIFLLFFSCLTVRTLAQDSTHAFNLGGRQPRSAASLQLRNFPSSPRSAHMLADGRRERGVKLLPRFTPLLWHGYQIQEVEGRYKGAIEKKRGRENRRMAEMAL